MYHLYILRFLNGKLYVGVTNNLERRLQEHQNKKSKWTRTQGEFKLVYSEIFPSLSGAKKREWELKYTPWGGKFKKKKGGGSFGRDPGTTKSGT